MDYVGLGEVSVYSMPTPTKPLTPFKVKLMRTASLLTSGSVCKKVGLFDRFVCYVPHIQRGKHITHIRDERIQYGVQVHVCAQ